MKKKARKLTLSRETLCSLNPGSVVGGATLAAGCATYARCTGACDDTIVTGNLTQCGSCNVCSGGCATGGACTDTCETCATCAFTCS
jgi:hypothetical protein